MDISYTFESISLNQRVIRLENILTGTAHPQTDFERDTLLFIKEWLQETHQFTIQTSGSTGVSKNIVITREQMQQSAKMTIEAIALKSGETALVCLPTKYIAGRMMLVRALVNNMQIIAVDPSSNPLEKVPISQKIDFSAFVPLQLQTMMDAGASDRINAIKNILIGGAAVNPPLNSRIQAELNTHLFATYGMTETITHIALRDLHNETDSNIFSALPGIKLSLDNRSCLVIEAPYLNGPVITNDLAELAGTNSFRWLGRADSVINSGGIKIIPEQMEASISSILKKLNILERFFIAGIPDERLGEKVVLFIESNPPSENLNEKIKANLKEALPPYAIPKQIMYFSKFLETETGKIRTKETVAVCLNQK